MELRAIDRDRTLVMGILNVTPDSFSDGGRWAEPAAAIARGEQMIGEGADIIDIGGESTRPGATPVPVEVELARALPVIEALAGQVCVSVDTRSATVAEAAARAGAQIVNDVSAGSADPRMIPLVAQLPVAYLCMYNTGPAAPSEGEPGAISGEEAGRPTPEQVMLSGLAERVRELRAAGVRQSQLLLDPGLGFAYAGAANWRLLAAVEQLKQLGYPLVVGASRKRFLASVSAESQTSAPGAPSTRDGATVALTALLAQAGVWAVRVHQVAENAAAVRVAAQLRRTREQVFAVEREVCR